MIHRITALTILSLIATSSVSHGQGQGSAVPAPPSGAMNWLNLNRAGNSPAVNYYGIVRPNAVTQNSLQNIQQEYNNLSQSVLNNDSNTTTMNGTGHSATFMNYGHYFPRMGNGATGASARPGGGSSPRR